MYPDVAGTTLDVMLIPPIIMNQFILVLNGKWCNGRRIDKSPDSLTGNNPEKVSNMRKTNRKWDQEGGAEKVCWHGYRPS